MFLSAKTYKDQLTSLISTASVLNIAVAFWGKGADQILVKANSIPRIICNLMTGASDPDVISLLCQRYPDKVRHMSDLHSKAAIGDSKMIVGSANFSSSGLTTDPNGQVGWEEAGVLSADKDQIEAAHIWFEQLWGKASPVLPRDIEIAMVAWQKNRKNRPVASSARRFLDLPIAEFEDRAIYVALWEDDASKAALKKFDEVQADAAKKLSATRSDDIDFFQDAADYPEDAVLISAQILPSGRIEVGGAWTRVREFDQELSGRTKGSIQIVVKRKRVLDRLFDAATQKALSRVIEKYAAAVKLTADPEYERGLVPLFRVLQYRTDA